MAAGERVALVTGASAGIGKSIVERLLSDGWRVYGAARRVDRMEDIRTLGAGVLAMDVTDDESIQQAIDHLLGAEGRIDALVNNAGYGSYGAIEDVPIEEARRQFEVNIFGLARLTQLVLPHMRAQGSGRIVNISSMGGRIWMPIGGWYHATKHALEVLSDALRIEARPFGIQVVVIQPGAIESEWSGIAAETLRAASEESPYREQAGPMIKLLSSYERAAKPAVVAHAVSKALSAKRPRRRYATPLDAKLLIFLHRWLPAGLWESVIRLAIR